MTLPNWADLPVLTRRSPKKLYELIKEEVNTQNTKNTETANTQTTEENNKSNEDSS